MRGSWTRSYGRHREEAVARTDVIVGLDYPRLLSLGRLARRTATGIVTKEQRCNGNVESLRNTFSRDSIIRWHFRSWQRKRQTMRAWHADTSGPRVVLLATPRDADNLVAMISN